MSFFGFDTSLDKVDGRNGGGDAPIEVYDWGSGSYDRLGGTLDDSLDELNDETFGASAADVGELPGKDFDFSRTGPSSNTPKSIAPSRVSNQQSISSPAAENSLDSRAGQSSLEAIWNDKSAASVLGRTNSESWGEPPSTASTNKFPVFGEAPQPQNQTAQQASQPRIRTLQEIEAEQLAKARGVGSSPALHHAPPVAFQHASPVVHHAASVIHQSSPALSMHQSSSSLHQASPRIQQGHSAMRQLSPGMHQGSSIMHQSSPTLHQGSPAMQNSSAFGHSRGPSLAQQQHARTQSQIAVLEGIGREMQAMQINMAGTLGTNRMGGIAMDPGGLPGGVPGIGMNHSTMMSMGPLDLPQYQPRSLSMSMKQQQQQQLLMGIHGLDPHPDAMLLPPEQREAVMGEAMRKIMETERMEEKRRIKATKINRMSKYNDLMSQSDKDFITRIQVSQLVTLDPSEDYYAQVLGSAGIPAAAAHTRGRRRENALQKMAAQVERIVSNAKARELEKGSQGASHLQGALGKVSGRSYKAAPRQLLQVEHDHISKEDAATAKQAAQLGREALGINQGTGVVKRDPLTRRQTLIMLEAIYDHVLKIEQLKRIVPEDPVMQSAWTQALNNETEALWASLHILTPLETSNPHPFASLLAPAKGKRLIQRLIRHLGTNQVLTMYTLLIAVFSQLDVVQGPEQDYAQTELFMTSVIPPLVPILANAGLRFVRGLLGLLIESGSNLVQIAGTRPGVVVLTILLSRVELLKTSEAEAPDHAELQAWQNVFDTLFRSLAPHLVSLFPSTRLSATQAFGGTLYLPEGPDAADEPVWQFCAALAVNADMQQQQQLVAELREKVLENVGGATKGWVSDDRVRAAKLANVNLFLHALGLDSSQIVL